MSQITKSSFEVVTLICAIDSLEKVVNYLVKKLSLDEKYKLYYNKNSYFNQEILSHLENYRKFLMIRALFGSCTKHKYAGKRFY